MSWSEDSLHRWLAKRKKPKGMVGSLGHDGAVLADRKGRPVLCTDACIEGVHFLPTASPKKVGHKAVARSLSDLAACGATPQSVLLAIRAPKSTAESRLRNLLSGVIQAADQFGAPLVGGDLSCAPGPLSLTVTAHGRLEGRKKPVGRDRGLAGQIVLLTGPVGGSLLGRHLAIEPRIAAGAFLWGAGATVLMDVSDGLALDSSRIARASKLAVHLEEVPLHRDAKQSAKKSGRSALEHGLFDGEDHELIACMSMKSWNACKSAALERFPNLGPIGRLRPGSGLHLDMPNAEVLTGKRNRAKLDTMGWIHGTS